MALAEFEYLGLKVETDCRTYDRVYASFWRKSIYDLKIFWKGLLGSLSVCDFETGAARHEIFTYVSVFNQGGMHTIKQEGRDSYEEFLDVDENTLLKELSVQLSHFGSRGWELVEVYRENKIDDSQTLYLTGNRHIIYKVHCTLKRLTK